MKNSKLMILNKKYFYKATRLAVVVGIYFSIAIAAFGQTFEWENASPEEMGFIPEKLEAAREILAKHGTSSILVVRNDKIVLEWYAHDSNPDRQHGTASLAKALVGGMSLLAAMNDGLIKPDDPAAKYVPSWQGDPLKSKITIRHLATHTSGMEDAEVSRAEQEEMIKKGLHTHMDLPGWKGCFWRQEPDPFLMARDSAPIITSPGTKYAYSNPGIGMLTYAVTSSLKGSSYKDIRTYLTEKIFLPIGMKENSYRLGYGKTFVLDDLHLVASWGGGNFTTRGVARIGRLMLNEGNWQGKQLIDPTLIKEVVRYAGTPLPSSRSKSPDEDAAPASTLGWYCNFDRVWENIPPDAFCGGGAGNQHLFVVPSLNLIVVRFGANLYDPSKGESFWSGAEKYLFEPIVDAIGNAPYPQSKIIRGVEIDWPTHQRHAMGSDNFHLTWANDDHQYGIWGDGGGFSGTNNQYRVSFGVARIEGDADNYKGYDRYGHKESAEAEATIEGKSWAILCVKGKLYAWVHPDGGKGRPESRLYVSKDKGASWQAADWAFTHDDDLAGGAILQFGKNYSGAIDNYVYHYFVQPILTGKWDLMVPGNFFLLRVHKNKMMKREAYEYFTGFDGDKPVWSKNIADKKPVFTDKNGAGWPTGISYNPGLKRFLLCTEHINAEAGILGIFEAPNPWGPWSTVTYARNSSWFGNDNPEVVPPNTFFWCFPTKWISSDGRTATMVFTGAGRGKNNDSFNTVRVRLLAP